MTAEVGARVRSLVDLISTDGYIAPIGTTFTVLGFEGDRLVLEWDDVDGSGERLSLTANPWEVLRMRPRMVTP